MQINSLRLLLVALSLAGTFGLTACKVMAGKPAEQSRSTASTGIPALDRRIDQAVTRMIDDKGRSQKKAPGMVIVYVSPRGSSVRGYGTTRIGTSDTPDGNTKFAVASVTKAFTGLMLAQAVKRGEIGLDDKVQPSLKPPLKDLFDPDITFRQLATHTSGLGNFPANLQDYRDNDGDGRNDWSEGNPANQYAEHDLVACMQQKQCGKEYPSNQFRYSNLGSGVLGIALQNQLGYKNYAEMLEGVITGPLGMNDTGLNEDEYARRLPERVAQGYSIGRDVTEAPYPNMGELAGGGGIFTTGQDMLKFLHAVTGLENSELYDAVTDEMTRELTTVKGRGMGYSVSVESAGRGKEYSKGGGAMGYSAYLIWKRDPQVGVMVMVNRGKFQKPASKLAEKILTGLERNL